MPTRVLLIRHAESADPSIFHGAESDVELSPRGHEQARQAAACLAGRGVDAVVSSGMRRALETAGPIARACGREVEVEPLLHERRVGALSGTPTALREGVWPETLQRWLAGQTSYAPPGAESFDDIRARVVPLWQKIVTRHAGRTVVVVAHGVVCRVLLVSLLPGHSVTDWPRVGPVPNVGLNELLREENGEWQLLRLNEVLDRA
jgi:broad specificity phosphatase PhoE